MINTPIVHVIDDDRILQMLLGEYLSKHGFDVVESLDGAEGFSNLCNAFDTNRQPKVVLIDHQLPTLSGIAILEKIRMEERLHSVPVIFMSASESPLSAEQIAELKPWVILIKPFKLSELLAIIDSLE